MRKGQVDTVSHNLIDGWAADTDHPDAALDVDLLVDDQFVARVTADHPRPDLAALGEFGAGRHGFSFIFADSLSADSAHHVSVRFANDGPVLPCSQSVLPGRRCAPAVASALTPILVTGPGRSGTTLLMGLLAHAPEIIAAEIVPYETRLLSYYANAHFVLTHTADIAKSTHPDELQGDGFHIGFNPYNSADHNAAFSSAATAIDFAHCYVTDRLDDCFRSVIVEYYCRLARDKNKPGVRFFVEKNNNLQDLVRGFTRRAFGGAREIMTIRDPRDVLCSYMSYFKTDADRSFTELSVAVRFILKVHAGNPGDALFNMYERLLRGESRCFTALSEFLQTDIVQLTDEARHEVFKRHGTSVTTDATVERWRTDLTQEWQDKCLQAWRPFLETFGYPLR